MWELIFKQHFDSAHKLEWHQGKCQNLHGHRWEVEIRIKTIRLDENGIVIDFGDLKRILPDHQNLNDWIPNPTAENIAQRIFLEVSKLCPSASIEITVWEGEGRGIKYYESK